MIVARLTILFFVLMLSATSIAAVETYTIGVIGTGKMGSAIGTKLASAGHLIVYGSRDPSRAEVGALVAKTGFGASATTQRKAVQQADIVILAVPWAPMKEIISNLGDLRGKIVVDITTADRQAGDGYLELSVASSTSELIRDWAPGARVVKTPFSAAQIIEDPLKFGEPTVTYIAADDREAKEVVARLAIQLNLFPLDAGPLRMARAIDHLGLLFLTPLIQGRDLVWVWMPRVAADYSCVSTEGWFAPVQDADDLARFPNLEGRKVECPSP